MSLESMATTAGSTPTLTLGRGRVRERKYIGCTLHWTLVALLLLLLLAAAEPTNGFFSLAMILDMDCFRDWKIVLLGYSFYTHPNPHHFTYYEAVAVTNYALTHPNVVLVLDNEGDQKI